MATMIGLVGDQPLPNFLAVRHFHYDKVLLVYTDEKKQEYKKLRAVLEKEPQVTVEGVETESHNINQIVQRLDEALTDLGLEDQDLLVFNLTGGTKAMSLAAFRVAQEHNAEMLYLTSEGKEVRVYHSAWSNQQLEPLGQVTIPECITLKDVFDLHLGIGNWQAYGPSKDKGGPFERLLADALSKEKDVSEVLSRIGTLNRQIEMDIVVRLGNHYGIIEAKTGREGNRTKGLLQLSADVSLLGTYARAFYVIAVPANPDHEELRKALGFRVISLVSYDETTQAISAQDEMKLLIGIKNAFLEPSRAFSVYF
jgi:hypothetical protein